MNLKQIRSIVKRNTGSDTMNMPDYSIDGFINLAQKEIVRQTLCLRKKATITTAGGSISSIDDAGGGALAIVTTAAHAMSTGDSVIIRGTDSYDGTYTITNTGATSFTIVKTWVADEVSGSWHKQEYSLPSDFHKSTEMKIGSNFPTFKTEEYILRLFTTDPATGTAYYYYIDREAGKYGLYPIPSGVETGVFMYRALPTVMSLDSDTPDIHEAYHDLIVAGASYRVAEQLNKTDLFNHFFAFFGVLMADMANDMATRQADIEPGLVQSRDILDA